MGLIWSIAFSSLSKLHSITFQSMPENILRCCYNAVNFHTNIHKRHPIAGPAGPGMGCLWWIEHLMNILPQFLQLFMQYPTIVERVITANNCIKQSMSHIQGITGAVTLRRRINSIYEYVTNYNYIQRNPVWFLQCIRGSIENYMPT